MPVARDTFTQSSMGCIPEQREKKVYPWEGCFLATSLLSNRRGNEVTLALLNTSAKSLMRSGSLFSDLAVLLKQCFLCFQPEAPDERGVY